jgi:hypothetical protein
LFCLDWSCPLGDGSRRSGTGGREAVHPLYLTTLGRRVPSIGLWSLSAGPRQLNGCAATGRDKPWSYELVLPRSLFCRTGGRVAGEREGKRGCPAPSRRPIPHPSITIHRTYQRITSATTKMHAPIGGLRHFFRCGQVRLKSPPPPSRPSPLLALLHQHLLNLTLHVVSRLGIGRCSTSFLERIAVQDPRRVAAKGGEPHAQPRVATQPPTLDPLPGPSVP